MKATLEKICERAQSSAAPSTGRYKGKDELIQAAVAEPFLALINAPSTNTIAVSNSWATVLAESVQRSIEAGAENPDTVKAGLLLKLHRRDPLSLGSRAIQLGLASEAEALRKWIAEAVGGSGSEIEVPLLAWLVNVLRDGLLLGVAFGQSYDQSALAELLNSMIFGIVAGAASGVFRSDV